MKLGIAITRAALVDATWTTAHLASAALARGHVVRFIEPWDFEVDARGQLLARAHAFDAPTQPEDLVDALRGRAARRCYLGVGGLDLLLLRAAPLDCTLLTFAMHAKALGVEIVNDPEGLLRVSHKGWLAQRTDVPIPPTLVTRSRGVATLFYARQPTGVVVKPARGSGGNHVAHVCPHLESDFDAAFTAASAVGDHYVVVQAYVHAADRGEKRLVWMDGEVLGGYLRHRAPGEFRHNLKQGGIAVPTEITDEDRVLAAKVGPHLLAAGIRIAGLDVIGGHLIEVNALNPGGAYHADRLTGSALSARIVAGLERRSTNHEDERVHGFPPAIDQEAGH